ncbi:MAG: oligosaccharide flippase family protein [Cyclobacteriaceae bacterium]
MRKDFKKIVSLGKFYFVGRILEKSLPFLFLPLYTKYLTPVDYGVLSLLTILVSWSEKVVAAPIGNGITRHFYDPTLQEVQREMIFSGWVFTFVQSIALSLCFVLFGEKISEQYLGDLRYVNIVFMFAFVMLTQPLGTLMFSLLRIQSKAKLYVTGNLIIFTSSAILQVLLLVYFEMGLEAMVWGVLFTSFAKLIFIFPFTLRNLTPKFNWVVLKQILHFGYPLIIAAVIAVLSKTLDRVLLNYYFDLAMVGLLALALKIASILDFAISTPFKQTIVPIIYEKESNKKEQLEFMRRMTTYVVAAVLFCTLGLSVFAKEIIMVVSTNPEFHESWKVVPFLLFTTANEGVAIMFGNGMAMAKKSLMISVTSFYVFIVNTLLLVVLIQLLGLVGAGVASAIAFTFRNVIRGYYSNKYYGQTFENRKIVAITGLSILLYIFSLQFNSLQLLFLIPAKLLVVGLLPVLIWKFNLISRSDKKLVVDFASQVYKDGLKSALKRS